MFPRRYFAGAYFGAFYFGQSGGFAPVGLIEYPWAPGYEYAVNIGTALPLVCTVPAPITGTPGDLVYPWTPGVIA